jgi:hypothetical protein
MKIGDSTEHELTRRAFLKMSGVGFAGATLLGSAACDGSSRTPVEPYVADPAATTTHAQRASYAIRPRFFADREGLLLALAKSLEKGSYTPSCHPNFIGDSSACAFLTVRMGDGREQAASEHRCVAKDLVRSTACPVRCFHMSATSEASSKSPYCDRLRGFIASPCNPSN